MTDNNLGTMRLFLYKPLETIEHLERLENYLTQNIWVTQLEDFNDPFEGKFKWTPINFHNLEQESPTFFYFLFDSYKKDNSDHTIEQFKQAITNEKVLAEHLSRSKKIIHQQFPGGVICLTTSPSDIPMWAHYANNHKGYCLIFELDIEHIREIANVPHEHMKYHFNKVLKGEDILWWNFDYNSETIFRFIFLKVKYCSDICSIDFIKLNNYLDKDKDEHNCLKYFLQNSIGAKFKEWEYEKEYRLITSHNSKNSGLIYLPTYAPFLKVTGIIAGKKLKCTPTFNVIETLAKKYSLKLHQTECSEEEYNINILPPL